jgi:hypothetical protein
MLRYSARPFTRIGFVLIVTVTITIVGTASATAAQLDIRGDWNGTTSVDQYTATDIDHDGIADVWCPGHVQINGNIRASHIGQGQVQIDIIVCGSPSTFLFTTSAGSISGGADFLFTPPTLLVFSTNPIVTTGRFDRLDVSQTSIVLDITGQYVRCDQPVAPTPGTVCAGGAITNAGGGVSGRVVR